MSLSTLLWLFLNRKLGPKVSSGGCFYRVNLLWSLVMHLEKALLMGILSPEDEAWVIRLPIF